MDHLLSSSGPRKRRFGWRITVMRPTDGRSATFDLKARSFMITFASMGIICYSIGHAFISIWGGRSNPLFQKQWLQGGKDIIWIAFEEKYFFFCLSVQGILAWCRRELADVSSGFFTDLTRGLELKLFERKCGSTCICQSKSASNLFHLIKQTIRSVWRTSYHSCSKMVEMPTIRQADCW